ncbi:MAG TPA: tetratricopeptide repeat protein [Polyangiaceae bacterium]|nr:tetratricopeptide repeat protein [Polyangiaceae bacterium]
MEFGRFTASVIALLGLVGAAGCSGGNVASELAKPPENPTKESKCGTSKIQARPLIVEWPSSDRAVLEARMKQGLVPVRYVGCDMEVLTTCKVPATYAYTGITPKNDRVVIHNQDELYANIPVHAAKFEAKLQKAGMLEVAMTIIGRYESNRGKFGADELQGECAEATHVVSALTVGAFKFSAGASAEVGGGAGVGDIGAGAKSTSDNETLSTDGDSKECAKATGEDKAPPFGCGALLRVELVPLGEARKEVPACPSGTAWDGGQCVAVGGSATTASTSPAPGSTASTATPATTAAGASGSAAGAQSKPAAPTCTDAPSCADACDKGQTTYCSAAAPMYTEGRGVDKDVNRGVGLYEKGCDGGDAKACVTVGEMLYNGKGVAKDAARAVALFRKACDKGETTGCVALGWAYESGTGVGKNASMAANFFGMACNDKATLGCIGLGTLYKNGTGVSQDKARAELLFKKACDAGNSTGCKMQKDLVKGLLP